MDVHINMTKSVLKLLTTLEQSLDITKDNNAKDDTATEGTEDTEDTKGTNDNKADDNTVPLDTGDIGITDFDSICNQLTIKDEIIDKLKSIIINKNEKIKKLITDITCITDKNVYLESKLVELTKIIKDIYKNVDDDTIIIDNKASVFIN